MTWTTDAVTKLVATFAGAVEGEGVVIAAAAVDGVELVVRQEPESTPSDARFEIGSIAKPITATLTALLAEEGKLALSDRIGKWLDAGPNGNITIEQLATHTSGLPRLSPNAFDAGIDRSNPYAHYTPHLAEKGLRDSALDPKETPRYSNFGFQLLGLVLERASGEPYGELLNSRVLAPLSTQHAGVRGTELAGTQLAGHSGGHEVPHWDQHLPGSGGIEASIADLAAFASACTDPPDSALGRAIREAQIPRVERNERSDQGLGWIVRKDGLIWHNGGTAGFSSSLILDPENKRAVALMVNSSDCADSLDQAVVLAVRGEDPSAARPTPPGPEWLERGKELGTAFLERRFDDIHQSMQTHFREKVSVKQLRRMWKLTALGLGKNADVSVKCRRRPGAVAAEVTVSGSKRATRLTVAWLETGEIAGLTILTPGQPSPF